MTLTHILYGLTAWTAVSIVVGLGLGALMKVGASADGMMPNAADHTPALRKSA